ncbi:hypothetical protein [Aeromicrobium stalagmiti]|uniref:hypothetical protein n=1 Tax=Aeromicrobium stalagmiti TaxID=2738988 RepID=UPI00156869E1|nr:hypothetical protein [Aeromicrobium stalagmiti]NRQ48711.1 hypothetical protein [Aeromicrobium stalagmiti]
MSEVVVNAATRAELLAQATADAAEAERRLFSLRRALPLAAWSLGLIIAVMTDADPLAVDLLFFVALAGLWWLVSALVRGPSFAGHLVALVAVVVAGAALNPVVEEHNGRPSDPAYLILCAIAFAGTAWTAATYVGGSRHLARAARAAHGRRRDPRYRALPAGEIDLAEATIFDLRDRADFDDASLTVVALATARLYSVRAAGPSMLLTLSLIFGIVAAVQPWLSDVRWPAVSLLCAVLLLGTWCWTFFVDMLRTQWRRQGEQGRDSAERQLYGLRRHLLAGESADLEPTPSWSLLAGSGGLAFAALSASILVVRIRSASALVLVVTGFIVVVTTTVVVAVVLWHRSRTRVYALDGIGDSVLQLPSRPVTLSTTGEGLLISDPSGRSTDHLVPSRDVLAVVPLRVAGLVGPSSVGIITTGTPIVLTGRGITTHPALADETFSALRPT